MGGLTSWSSMQAGATSMRSRRAIWNASSHALLRWQHSEHKKLCFEIQFHQSISWVFVAATRCKSQIQCVCLVSVSRHETDGDLEGVSTRAWHKFNAIYLCVSHKRMREGRP